MSFLKTMINSIARTFGRIIAYALIGLVIYFIGSKFAFASPQYRVSTGSWGEWTNVNVDTDYSFATSVSSSWSSYIQLKDSVAFENNKTYNLTANLEVILRESGTRDMNSALDPYIFNGSTLTNQTDKCTITGTRSDKTYTSPLTYTTHTYKVNVNCVGLKGQGYYPYLTLRFLTDSSQATTFTFNIKSWEYHVGSDSTDANNIMNNANQNTQQIIENYNQNTQEIIQNNIDLANNLAETIENQNKVCSYHNLMYDVNNNTESGILNISNGNLNLNNNFITTTDYIKITNGKTITMNINNSAYGKNYVVYDNNKQYINGYTTTDNTITYTPTQDGYLRVSFYNTKQLIVIGEYCYNALEKETEQNEEINDNLHNMLTLFSSDSTPSENEVSSILSDVNFSDDTPVSNFIMFPIVIFSFFSESMSRTCSPISLGELYGHELQLPCLNLPGLFGATLWNMIDLLFCFFMIYNIVHFFISIFEDVSELRSPFLKFFIKNRGVIEK